MITFVALESPKTPMNKVGLHGAAPSASMPVLASHDRLAGQIFGGAAKRPDVYLR